MKRKVRTRSELTLNGAMSLDRKFDLSYAGDDYTICKCKCKQITLVKFYLCTDKTTGYDG